MKKQKKKKRHLKQKKPNKSIYKKKSNKLSINYFFRAAQVNTEDYFCNFIIDTEEQLDLSDDEESDLNELDAFEEDVDMDNAEEEEPMLSDEEEEDAEEEEEEEEDDDMEEEESEDEEHDDSEPVTMEILKEWCLAATVKKSTAAWKKLLMAFRSVVRSGDDVKFSYHVNNSRGNFYRKKS